MPLDDLSLSDDLKRPQPVYIDRSSGLGAALSGTIEKELPGAMAESKANAAEEKRLAQETAGRLEADTAKRALLQAPPAPPPSKPPEPEFKGAGEAWGSIAMTMAMLGSAFTRRPFLNSLNAGAEVMKAFRQNDVDEYKRNFDRWKAETDYGIKLYEYQRDAYKDAIESISTDQKDALAKLKVLSAALKDDPMHRLAEAGNVAGVLTLEQQRQTTMDHTRTLTEKAQQEGQITGELLEAGKALREAQKSGDPNAIAQAQQRYQAAQLAAKDLHTATRGDAQTPAKGREQAIEQAVAADVELYQQNNPDATQAEINAEAYKSRLRHEEEMGAAVRQPRSAPAMALQQYIKETTEKTGHPPTADQIQTFAAKGAEKTSEGRAVGTRSAGLEMAANAVEALIPLVKQTSDKINRTEFPSVNSVIVAAQKGTGGTDVVRFVEMINSLKYLYARALSPTGQARVADLANFDKIVSENWTKGQINAALDQIQQSINVERGAIAKTRGEIAGGGVPAPQAQSAAAPTVSDPLPVPAGLRGDPDGTGYRKDGKVWVKQGDYLVETPGAVETK